MGSLELVDINQELKKQWDKAQGENKVRASLFNLIIYAKKNKRADYYENLVKSVVSKFPCRIILIISDAGQNGDYLKTSVSSEAVGNGGSQIFCEIITIRVAGIFRERTYFLLLPHLLCDLPIYLLWTKDPTEKSLLLPRLERIASRIIFDSEESSNLAEYAQTTLSLLKRFHCEIGDLNWSALSGWRKIIADYFDSPMGYKQLLASKKIKISYAINPDAEHRHNEIEAAYLQSWLASMLNWKYTSLDSSEGQYRLSYQTLLGECVLYLKGKEVNSLPSGTILTLEIESIQSSIISFARKGDQIVIKYSDKERCDLPCYNFLPDNGGGKEIIEELFRPSGKQHYKKTLENLSQIPWGTL
jgi:glucose-6-phosphate dehydrogenase assembly protein OpcA